MARGNLWLALLGVALLAVTLAPGREGFVQLVGQAYEQGLPMRNPVFRPDLAEQTRGFYWILLGLGWCALAAYGLLRRARMPLASWLLGRSGEGEDKLLAIALLVVIAYSGLFVSLRIVRDGLRFRDVAGLSPDQRALLLFAQHAGEPDYGPARAFRERAGGRGNLAILREQQRFVFASLYYASYLFPIRSYVVGAETCKDAERIALAASTPHFDWIEADCKPGFHPTRRDELP